MKHNRIYCSGPLFCAEEVGGMSAIARVLEEAGLETFLPHRDGLEPYVMRFGTSSLPAGINAIRSRVDYAIFSLDMYELVDRCDGMVCNLNGRVPDEGMIVEAALAFAAGKPLVMYKDDARAPFGGYDNSMLTSLVRGNIAGNIKELPLAIERALRKKPASVALAPDVQAAAAYGKRLSSILEHLPEGLGKKRWSEEVLLEILDTARQEEAYP